jgi:hypothetical protein
MVEVAGVGGTVMVTSTAVVVSVTVSVTAGSVCVTRTGGGVVVVVSGPSPLSPPLLGVSRFWNRFALFFKAAGAERSLLVFF